jgi:hypothetical protein
LIATPLPQSLTWCTSHYLHYHFLVALAENHRFMTESSLNTAHGNAFT